MRKGTPLPTAGAIGTEHDTLSELHEEPGDDEEEGHGQSLATGATSGPEPHATWSHHR